MTTAEANLFCSRFEGTAAIFISGSQIEPAEEYKFKYVDLAAKLLGLQEETASYRAAQGRALRSE